MEREDLAALRQEVAERQAEVLAELSRPLEIAAPETPEGQVVLQGRVEDRAFDQRLTAEHFVVVRTFDGRLAYCTRLISPATATERGRELHLVQIYRDNRLESFDLKVRPLIEAQVGPSRDDSGAQEAGSAEEGSAEGGPPETGPLGTAAPPMGALVFWAQGALIGDSNRMAVQRRLGGVPIDNKTAERPINVVDASNVLTGLIAAQHFPEGYSFAVTFEGEALEPYIDRWELRVREQDHQLQIMTSRGWLAFDFDERGVPLVGLRRAGNSFIDVQVQQVETGGGPGLPLGEERVAIPRPEEDAGAAEGGSGDSGAGDDDR
jgi:hypothetical protein